MPAEMCGRRLKGCQAVQQEKTKFLRSVFELRFFKNFIVLSFRLFVKAYRSIELLTKLRLPQNLEGSGVPEYRYCLVRKGPRRSRICKYH